MRDASICFLDATMSAMNAANPTTRIHTEFLKQGREAIHPRRAFIENDSKIMAITAKKMLLNDGEKSHFRVVIRGAELE